MTWEQPRYAVERARDRLQKQVEAINDHCAVCLGGRPGDFACSCVGGPTYAGVTLQGEAASSDAEMLDEVADFLKSLDGAKTPFDANAFAADVLKMMVTIGITAAKYNLQKPEILFNREWQIKIRVIPTKFYSGRPTHHAGVRIHFGTFEPATILRPF